MNLAPLKTPLQTHVDTAFSAWGVEQLDAWIASLRYNDPVVYGGTVYSALLNLNRTRLQQLSRYTVMERLRPVINDICAMLIGRYRRSPLPLAAREQAEADLVLRLYGELATGFKIAVNDEITRYLQQGDAPTALQLAIQRALLSLGRVLLECYRVYAPEPPLLWRDIHALYRNSEQARLQALPLYAALDSDETALAIKQAYLRIAVLALSNPYHLLQGEADELYRRIGRWVHFVQMRPAPTGGVAGTFAVDLDADLPARYFPSDLPLPTGGDLRILDLQQLADALNEQIGTTSALLAAWRSGETLSMRMQRDMYIRFRSALTNRRERGSKRQPTLARLTVALGLDASHALLSGRQATATADNKTVTLPAQTTAQWNRKNESDSGMALFCAKDSPLQAQVGELVVYTAAEAATAEAWQIGVIRWLRTRPNSGLELGIEQLADSGHAVAIQTIADADRGRNRSLRGILTPRSGPSADTATLLAPASAYTVDATLRLQLRDRSTDIRLTELLETTSLFAHFRFKLLKEADSPGDTALSA
ncbi:MAG TPA: hypothetical protein VFY81_15135 [Gammaproteobacteria bacterium]|nr:hypothetical protein [Gammaproteobacteria bacterium]